MKAYVYHEANDLEPFGEMITRVFANKDKAKEYLRKSVENYFGEPWEKCEEIVEEEDGQFFETYVEYHTGYGFQFWVIDEHNLVD